MRYHPSPTSPTGYRRCNATVRACPYGNEEHIEAATEEELNTIIQRRLETQYSNREETLGASGEPTPNTTVPAEDNGHLLLPMYADTSLRSKREVNANIRTLQQYFNLHATTAEKYRGDRFYHDTADGAEPAGQHEVRNATSMDERSKLVNKPTGTLWLSAGRKAEDGQVATEWEEYSRRELSPDGQPHAAVYEPILDRRAVILDLDDPKNKETLGRTYQSVGYYDYDTYRKYGVDIVLGGRSRGNTSFWDVRSMAILNGGVVHGWYSHKLKPTEVHLEEDWGPSW